MCIERYVLGISLIRKAKLKRTLVGCLVETSVKVEGVSL